MLNSVRARRCASGRSPRACGEQTRVGRRVARAPSIEPRGIPDWGVPILSQEACVCVGPPKDDFPEQKQAEAFAEYAFGLFEAYAAYATETARRIVQFVRGERPAMSCMNGWPDPTARERNSIERELNRHW